MKREKHTGKAKKRRTGLGFIALFVMVICGVVAYRRVLLEEDQSRAVAAYEAASEAYEDEREREAELDELKVYTQTKKFIEDMAREKFGLVYENEIIFQPEE